MFPFNYTFFSVKLPKICYYGPENETASKYYYITMLIIKFNKHIYDLLA